MTYYFCLEHNQVEQEGQTCRADNRLGPYDSPEAARNWKQTVESRNDKWDEDDEDWESWGDEEE